MKISLPTKHNKHHQGVSLLYAVLILSGVALVSLAIASLSIRSLKQAQDFEKGMVAYYAAESGVEQALYNIYNSNTTSPVSGSLTELSASWNYTVQTTFNCGSPYTQEILGVDETLEFDDLGSLGTYNISWSDFDGNPANDKLEVTRVGWQDNFTNFALDANYEQSSQNVYKMILTSSTSGTMSPDRQNNLIRLKPLGSAVQNLSVCFSGSDITDKVRIDTVGSFQGHKKAIESTYTNTGGVVFGYGDYVIFSEDNFK